MQIKCYKCDRTATGDAQNGFILCDQNPGWLPFWDQSNGLTSAALCPDHSPVLEQALALLDDLFGEKSRSMNFCSTVKRIKAKR